MSSSSGGGASSVGAAAPRPAEKPAHASAGKPPKMVDFTSFDGYRRALVVHFRRFEVMDVADGTVVRPDATATEAERKAWDGKDLFIQSCLLGGVDKKDQCHINNKATGHLMWDALVQYKTRRDSSNYVYELRKMNSHDLREGMDVDKWIEAMEGMRRRLEELGEPLTDARYAEVLMTTIAASRRSVLRFLQATARGTNRPVTAEDIFRELRVEDDLDKHQAQDAAGNGGGTESKILLNKQVGKGKQGGGKQGGGKQAGGKSGQYKAKAAQKGTQMRPPRKARACWKCGSTDHLKADCPKRASNNDNAANPSFRRYRDSDDDEEVNILTVTTGSGGRSSDQGEWTLDSGSCVHVCKYRELMVDMCPSDGVQYLGCDGKRTQAEAVGSVVIRVQHMVTGKWLKLKVNEVRLIPSCPRNLLSLHRLQQNGWHVEFSKPPQAGQCWLSKNTVKLELPRSGSSFVLHSSTENPGIYGLDHAPDALSDAEKWHSRLAHVNVRALCECVRDKKVIGVSSSVEELQEDGRKLNCMACELAKKKRMSYKSCNPARASKNYQKLMADVCYVNVLTAGKQKHFQLVQDEASRYTWGFLIVSKGQATANAMQLIDRLRAEGRKIGLYATDQGKELINNKMKAFLDERGIHYEWTNAYSPEENALVEKLNNVVLAKVRAVLTTVDMPDMLWGEAFNFVVDVINVSPTKALGGDTPYSRLFGRKPNLSCLRVWGTVCVVFEHKKIRGVEEAKMKKVRGNKLDNPGQPMLFLGYPSNSIGFRLLCLRTGKTVERRDAKFHESMTVERDYVQKLLENKYRQTQHVLPTVVPYLKYPVVGGPSRRTELPEVDPAESSATETVKAAEKTVGLQQMRKKKRKKQRRRATMREDSSSSSDGGGRSSDEDEVVMIPTTRAPRVPPAEVLGAPNPRRLKTAARRAETGVGATPEGVAGLTDRSTTRSRVDAVDNDDEDDGADAGSGEIIDYSLGSDEEGQVVSDGEDGDDGACGTETPPASGGDAEDAETGGDTRGDEGESEGESDDDNAPRSPTSTRTPTPARIVGGVRRNPARKRKVPDRYTEFEVDLPESLIALVEAAGDDPKSLEEAMNSPEWKEWEKATDLEFNQLIKNKTWRKVKRIPGVPVLSCKWVLVRKRNAKGEVVRFKARLTIRGFLQRKGINYFETYASVVRAESMKFLLALALAKKYQCRHVDFVTAFLNGPIEEGVTILMEQPEGYEDGTDRVCLLLRSLYGLKQAPRVWNETLHKQLVAIGFDRMYADAGVYRRVTKDGEIFMSVYVDDLLIVGLDPAIDAVIAELRAAFELKDLGPVSQVLGMEVKLKVGESVTLSQAGYVERILCAFDMDKSRTKDTPEVLGTVVTAPPKPYGPEVNMKEYPYRAIVGALQYLVTCTRPDIAHAVQILSKYTSCYTVAHYKMAKRVLRYLSGTRHFGLVFRAAQGLDKLQIEAFADADLAKCVDSRRSITGYVIQVNGCTIAYKSKQQSCAVDDTCSAEFVAASQCMTEVVWVHNLCVGLKVKRATTVLHQDNQATIASLKNVAKKFKVRGVDIKYHKVRDLVEQRVVEVRYCPTTEMIADILTKPLAKIPFEKLRKRLCVEDVRGDRKRVRFE